jgi:hypothetical protein
LSANYSLLVEVCGCSVFVVDEDGNW